MKSDANKLIVSIVVPFLNEEGNLEELYLRITRVLENIDYEFELILIDDGSTDCSLKVAEDLRRKDPRVKILSFTRNFGHQIALSAGLEHAEGDAIIMMDSDLQHPPEIIPKLIKKWQEGFENVYTIRKDAKNVSFFKRFGTIVFYNLFRVLAKADLPINSADFRLLDRKIVLSLRSIKERNRFLRGIINWTGSRSIGIEYEEAERFSGKIKYNFMKMLFLALDAITSFSTIPLYVGIFIGMIFAFLGFTYFSYVLYLYVFKHTVITGWSSVVSLIAIMGGIQLIVTGLVGVYIGKIFQEVKQRPLYLIRYSEGFNDKIFNR